MRPRAVPAARLEPADGEPFALLSLEMRRLPRPGSRIDGDVAGRILNRCVVSALRVLSNGGVHVDLAGTVLRPVIEATFDGAGGALAAATAGLAVRDAVRKVQRESENEFHVMGAITVGTTAQLERGVRVVAGNPRQMAARIREHSTPGQILVARDAWWTCRDAVVVADGPVHVTVPGSEPVPSYSLSSVR
jgi:class 3 adenylate cyclase